MAQCSGCGGRGFVTRGGIGPNGPVMGNVPCPVCTRGKAMNICETVDTVGRGIMQTIGLLGLVFIGLPAIFTVIAQILKAVLK